MMKQVPKRDTKSQTNVRSTDRWNAAITGAALKTALGDAVSSGEEQGVRATLRRAARMVRGGFALEVDIEGLILELNVPGLVSRYQIAPVITALEIAAGVAATRRSLLQIAQRLQSFIVPEGYLSARNTKEGALILDDTAASTSESMLAGLKALAALGEHRCIAVLEDPIEAVAKQAPHFADMVLLLGDVSERAQKTIHTSDITTDTHHFVGAVEASKWFKKYLKSTDTILVSGNTLQAFLDL